MTIQNLCRSLILVALSYSSMSHAFLLPDKAAWERWRPAADSQRLAVDHSPWGQLLMRYLDTSHPSGINRFNYAGVTESDRQVLNAYIADLALTKVAQLTPAQQQAYWINLYNALTVQLILQNPSVESIREIKSGFFSIGPWGREVVVVDGEEITLNDIEHRILRPLYGDPRVHFAVNCASIGCPNLQGQPFTAERLESMLDSAAREYVNHPRGVSMRQDKLLLSSIFKWFSEDFGNNETAVIRYLTPYAEPELAQRLRAWQGRVSYDYDWALNAP